MNYELVTTIRPDDVIFQRQKARLEKNGGQILSTSPSPDFYGLLAQTGVTGINIIDALTKRSHDAAAFRFFNQAPVPQNAAIFMNEDFTISVLHEGEEIGRVETYPETRRHVKELSYTNLNGSPDFTEEFAADGKRYSRIYFHAGHAEEIDFLNDEEFPVVSYFFYEGGINEVMIRDPKTREVLTQYDSLDDFIAMQVAESLTAADTVSISYMGLEMSALVKSPSHNVLYLEESPFDESGQLRQNLYLILEDEIPYIHEVKLDKKYFAQLRDVGVSMKKAGIVY